MESRTRRTAPFAASAPVSELTAHLGFWMRAVSNHVSQSFAAKLAGVEVSVAEWVMMRLLYGLAPMAPSRIAAEMGMTRGAITKLADRLIARSLVVRTASPDDGRAQTLALTPRGKRLVPQLAAIADRNDAEFFGHLSPEERASLELMLRRMVAGSQMPAMPVD